MKKTTFFVWALLATLCVSAQSPIKKSGANDLNSRFNDDILHRLDSLVYMVHKNTKSYPVDTARINQYHFAPNLVPDYTDEEYEKRLASIPAVIPMVYHEDVGKFIRMYAKRKDQVGRLLGLQEVYFPIFEEALDRHGLPMELKYLPIIESAFNPVATSRAGAVGLWQFILSTGKLHGMTVNSLIDERRDPVKETEAACVFFEQLYSIYGDWHLVLAAYNCGPGNVNRAIQKAGGSLNYWVVRQFLPGETKNYVPGFIAATYIMHYHAEHNLYPKLTDFSYFVDTIHVTSYLDLNKFANMVDMDPEELRALNPELKKGVVPRSNEPYVLRVPRGYRQKISSNRLAYLGKGSVHTTSPQEVLQQKMKDGSVFKEPKQTQTTHVVVKGETVSEIAQRYKVDKQDLCAWNTILNDRIWAGKKLIIYKPAEGGEIVDKTNLKKDNKTLTKSNSKSTNTNSGGQQYHTVRSGDSLWSIAKLYNTTVENLKQWNSISKNLQPGQKLIVGKG